MKCYSALWPTPRDERDFKLGAVMGHARPMDLPDEYTVAEPLVIKDQGQGTDMCTAYALTSVSEDEEGVVLDPFYTFGATKFITGDKAEWGADLRSAAMSAVAPKILGKRPYGFLEAKDLSKLTTPATPALRDAAADYTLITSNEETEARKHAKKSFFAVDGPYDLFDNMRSAMWQTRSEKRSIFTGCNWRSVWTHAGPVIETAPAGQTFGHAVKVFGWSKGAPEMGENGLPSEPYMKLQLSNGKNIGDGGIFYIGRDALNQAFSFGAFTFLDMPREDAQQACVLAERRVSTFFGFVRSPFTRFFNTLYV